MCKSKKFFFIEFRYFERRSGNDPEKAGLRPEPKQLVRLVSRGKIAISAVDGERYGLRGKRLIQHHTVFAENDSYNIIRRNLYTPSRMTYSVGVNRSPTHRALKAN